MKWTKKIFNKNIDEKAIVFEVQDDEKHKNINDICRFKLMLNHKTGKYEKVLVYHADELTRDKNN